MAKQRPNHDKLTFIKVVYKHIYTNNIIIHVYTMYSYMLFHVHVLPGNVPNSAKTGVAMAVSAVLMAMAIATQVGT